MEKAFLDVIGGKARVERVHTKLYDKLLSHPWLKEFFVGLERWHLEVQQTDFMCDLFGGPPRYCGRAPMRGHQHLYITEEVFMIRHNLLAETLSEVGLPADHKERWLQFDLGMKAAIVKKTVEDCEGRYRLEEIIVVPKPD